MSNRSEAEISEAVRECATLCAKTADVPQCVLDYARGLTVKGWSGSDIAAVIRSVRQVLDLIGDQLS
jgi:hypothetical protein